MPFVRCFVALRKHAYQYLHIVANNIDLSPETNNICGSIDFKLSRECNQKVLVKVKLSSNNQLEHGFEVQLSIYMIYMTKRKHIVQFILLLIMETIKK